MQKETADLIQEFMGYLASKECSPLTLDGYKADLNDFFDEIKLPPLEVKRSHCIARVASLVRRGLASRTVRRKFASVSSFFKYLMYVEKATVNPIFGLSMPKPVAKRTKVVITEEEAKRMLDLPCQTRQERMDRLCTELLYSTAGRRADVANALLKDLNLEESTLFVIGKGRKAATLNLNPICVQRLREYLENDRPKESTSPFLVLDEDGEKFGTNRVYNSILRIAKRAGITKHVHPHAWRRSAATHLMDRGMSLKGIQTVLRHNNLATTDIYLSADSSKVKKEIKTYHPRGS